MLIKKALLIILFALLLILTYQVDSNIESYFLLDGEFQEKIVNSLELIKQENNDINNQKLLSLLDITKMRTLEHGVILNTLNYLYFFLFTSLILILMILFKK